jgi:hypothetical protein
VVPRENSPLTGRVFFLPEAADHFTVGGNF